MINLLIYNDKNMTDFLFRMFVVSHSLFCVSQMDTPKLEIGDESEKKTNGRQSSLPSTPNFGKDSILNRISYSFSASAQLKSCFQ